MSAFASLASALPLKADVAAVGRESPKLTQSGLSSTRSAFAFAVPITFAAALATALTFSLAVPITFAAALAAAFTFSLAFAFSIAGSFIARRIAAAT